MFYSLFFFMHGVIGVFIGKVQPFNCPLRALMGCLCPPALFRWPNNVVRSQDWKDLRKCDLVPEFAIVIIAPPIGFNFVIFYNCIPVRILTATLALRTSFILVLGLRFEPQLTIKLSIVFNFPWLCTIGLEKINLIFENSNLLNWTGIKLKNMIFHRFSA